jgi:hypothetical protein
MTPDHHNELVTMIHERNYTMATYSPAGTLTLTATEVKEALIAWAKETLGHNIERAATWASSGAGATGGVISFDSRQS